LKLADVAFGAISEGGWRPECDHIVNVIEKGKANDCYREHDLEKIIKILYDTSSGDLKQ
jgi:hypothetical protein